MSALRSLLLALVLFGVLVAAPAHSAASTKTDLLWGKSARFVILCGGDGGSCHCPGC